MKARYMAYGVVCLGVLVCGTTIDAQPAQEPQQTAAVTPEAAETGPQMGLVEVVSLAVAQDPNIKLRATDVDLQAGVAEQASGQFDPVLRGGASGQYHQEELLASVKQNLQFTRDELDRAIPIATAKRDTYSRALDNLNDPRLTSNPDSVNLSAGITDQSVKDELDVLQAQLSLIHDLIARTVDPTIRNDFITLRDETLDRARLSIGAIYSQIEGEPERLRQVREDLGSTPESQWNRKIDIKSQLDKQFRMGLFVSPYVDFSNTAANYVGKSSTDPDLGGLGVKPVYRGEVGFDVLMPLARGRGSEDLASVERAAGVDLQSRRYLATHEAAVTAASTMQAYWTVRAAAERVEVLKRSVALEGELLKLTRELIKAREAARADEARILAAFSDAQANLEGGQRSLIEARMQLARVMGIKIDDARMAPLAGETFPKPPDSIRADDASLANLATSALGRRFDQRAALKSEESGKLLVRGAQLETRPVFDLKGRVWGTTVGESSPRLGRWTFRSGQVELDYEIPFGNNVQLGQLAQRQAGLNQAMIRSQDLARTIRINVARLGKSLELAAQRVRSADQAVQHYDKTIEDERAKLRAGESTLIDSILTEQQTTSARLADIAARQDYATILAQLRYEAGILLEEHGEGGRVSAENLTSVPPPLLEAAGEKK